MRKGRRDHTNLREGRIVLVELNSSSLFAHFLLSMGMYLMAKTSIVTILLFIIN